MSIWKNHMEKLINVENEWGDCVKAVKVEGSVSMIEVAEAETARKAYDEQEGKWTNSCCCWNVEDWVWVLLRVSDEDF